MASATGVPCATRTSTWRSLETISSGVCRFFRIVILLRLGSHTSGWTTPMGADQAEERGRTQALGRDRHLQDAGSAGALHSLGRPGRGSDPRPALVHALPGPGPRGSGARRDDGLAVSREARASGAGRGAV